jgi:hypothetical protein
VLKRTPRECTGCPVEIKRRWGCGYDERYRGKAKVRMAWSKLKTCPQFYARDPDVAYVMENLEDYRRGALGPIGRLSAPLVDYLRFVDNAKHKWDEANSLEEA